ncbi:MAG: ATP-binding protein [Elusimicrobiaceae bacterium]|nr:ATP-binding protein [Elusimicrobiaceae bacterium]
MYIQRTIETVLRQYLKRYSVVTVTGPRQSGKTTLLRKTFDFPYYSMETPDIRSRVLADPRGFFDALEKGCILDEIQRAPELLSYIQEYVDRPNNKLKFILSGSQQLNLLNSVSQSLAGRTALTKLLPLSYEEIKTKKLPMDDILYRGLYPRLYSETLNPTQVYRDYTATYLERDVRQLLNVHNMHNFQKFLFLCAGRIGQLLNMNSLANEVGVNITTIQAWFSVLEASFVVFLLYPYSKNINKRVVKTPKLYFCDTGLASYLLGIESAKQLTNNMYRGALFENFVLLELMKQRYNSGKEPNLYFYRDSNQNEIDCVAQWGEKIIPMEIKSSKTFNTEFLKGLTFAEKIIPNLDKSLLIYTGNEDFLVKHTRVINFAHLSKGINN